MKRPYSPSPKNMTAQAPRVDLGAREMIAGSHRVALTRREFDTLYYLTQRSGDVVGREDILNDVGGTTRMSEATSSTRRYDRYARN